MNIYLRTVFLVSLTTLAAGCATNSPRTTGTEDIASAEEEMAEAVPQVGILDSDGDSVIDVQDQCADTGVRSMVDSTGCAVPMGVISGLNFSSNQTNIPESANGVLDRYVDVMNRYPDVVVSIEAHTDNRGPAASNLELSKERVLSVVRYMTNSGINPARIKPFGYGESLPIVANATAEGREQNRRIEIKVLEGFL